MSNTHIHMSAAGLWVAAGVLMVVQSFNAHDSHLGQWALFVALIACVPTGWALLIRERLRMERLAKIMSSEMCKWQRESDSGVRRIK